MKVALAQMNSTGDWNENLRLMVRSIAKAAKENAKWILFPENALFVGDSKFLFETALKLQDVVPSALAEQAEKHRIAILLGSYPERAKQKSKVYNTSLFFDDSGKMLARYRKIHLFDVVTPLGERYSESRYVSPGKNLISIRWKGFHIGFSICYDLRFPEHFRALRAKGVDVIVLPSAFTYETGQAHWHPLVRARAVENLGYVLAPAQTGRHTNGRRTYGHSLVVAPWGNILSERKSEPGLLYAELKEGEASRLRRRFQAQF